MMITSSAGYQGLENWLGYNELHYCKVTSSVMCPAGAKYKSDSDWEVGWVLARNLNLGDTLVPNVCRLCIWDDMECQPVETEQNFANKPQTFIKSAALKRCLTKHKQINISGCSPISVSSISPAGGVTRWKQTASC